MRVVAQLWYLDDVYGWELVHSKAGRSVGRRVSDVVYALFDSIGDGGLYPEVNRLNIREFDRIGDQIIAQYFRNSGESFNEYPDRMYVQLVIEDERGDVVVSQSRSSSPSPLNSQNFPSLPNTSPFK